jgi:ankyrin repeat protein
MMSTKAERARDLLEAYNAAKMMKEEDNAADVVADLLDRAGCSLLEAVNDGDIDECRELLAIEGVDIHIKYSSDFPYLCMTPVMWACRIGCFDIAKLLMSKGANVHDKDTNGWSCLMQACNFGHFDIAEYLESNGASIYEKNNYGLSCLMQACGEGHLNIVLLLLSKGASFHEIVDNMLSCCSVALRYKRIRVLYRLRKWPTTMAIIVLQELALIYIIDSEAIIDLHQYLGRPEDLETDNEEDYEKDDEGNVLDPDVEEVDEDDDVDDDDDDVDDEDDVDEIDEIGDE